MSETNQNPVTNPPPEDEGELWTNGIKRRGSYDLDDPIHYMTNEMIGSHTTDIELSTRPSLERRRSAERLETPLKFKESDHFDERRKEAILERWLCFCFPLAIRIVLCASIGSFLFGFNISLLNTALNTIASDYGWCELPGDIGCSRALVFKAFISTAVFIGAALGAMTGGRFLFMGRRVVYMINMVVFVVGIISSVTANSFSALLWARLLVGYGVGVVSVIVPVYISEMSPPEKRGSYGVFHQLFITIGIFIAVVLGLPFSHFPSEEAEQAAFELPTFDRIWWRVMLGLGILPIIVGLYFSYFVFTFETPHFFVQNNQLDDARRLLRQLYNQDDVTPALEAIIQARNDSVLAEEKGLTLWASLKIPAYRHVLIVGCLISAFQQFVGINVFVVSSNSLFASAGLEPGLVTGMSTVLTFINVIMTFPAIYLIERLGRKTLLLIGVIGMTAAVIPGTIMMWINKDLRVSTWLAIAGAIVFIIFFSVSYGPVLWVYLFEIYPLEIKGAATGVAAAVNWLAGIVMVFITGLVSIRLNYSIFSGMGIIAGIIVFTMMRETKGRKLEESPFMYDKHGNRLVT